MMASRPNTNWSFLFLNMNIAINVNIAEPKNKPANNGLLIANTSTPSFNFQMGNINMKPPEIMEAINKYMVCIRCNIL